MKHLFKLSVYLYFATYLLPFVDGYMGYEIEFEMWNEMRNATVPDMDIATLWSFRWLTNLVILGLWWLSVPAVHTWMRQHIDKALLDKLLLVVLFLFVCYPFFFEYLIWQWGGLLWVVAAVIVGLSYQLLETPEIKEKDGHYKLEDHLVELRENGS